MLIYPITRMKEGVSYGAFPGSVFHCQDKRWMVYEVLCELKRHFISVVKPMPWEKLLLILDEHSTHTQGLAAIEITRKHGVVMLSLHSHCKNRLQPLDITFLKQLDTYEYMASAIATKLSEKPGQRLSTEHIASLIGMAFPRAATMESAMNGFRNSGPWPADHCVCGWWYRSFRIHRLIWDIPTRATNCRRDWKLQPEFCTFNLARIPKTNSAL
jgi:hypothetical protein